VAVLMHGGYSKSLRRNVLETFLVKSWLEHMRQRGTLSEAMGDAAWPALILGRVETERQSHSSKARGLHIASPSALGL
jgi:hypothetical protein